MAKEFYTATCTGFDSKGHGHLVTVVGRRHATKDEVWETSEHQEVDGKNTFTFVSSKEKTWHLDLAYSIQHEEDKTDSAVGERICKRRLRKKEEYLRYDTVGNMRPSTVQAIVEAEAHHIASKVESFMKRINDNALETPIEER